MDEREPPDALRWAVAGWGVLTVFIGAANNQTAMVALGLIAAVFAASADEL